MIRSFRGITPRIAASAYVDVGAHVIGDVEMGDNSGGAGAGGPQTPKAGGGGGEPGEGGEGTPSVGELSMTPEAAAVQERKKSQVDVAALVRAGEDGKRGGSGGAGTQAESLTSLQAQGWGASPASLGHGSPGDGRRASDVQIDIDSPDRSS